MYTIIETCWMIAIDPQAYLTDVLARIADHPIHRIDELLPWSRAKYSIALTRAASNLGRRRTVTHNAYARTVAAAPP
jgi:hypothetical protein